jgi:hypothetical protein
MKEFIRERFINVCGGLLAGACITVAAGLFAVWIKLTFKFLDYVWGLI